MALNDQTDKMLEPKKDETFFDKYVAGEKTKGMFNPSAKDVADFGSDFIPGVSETKDIISLGTNVGKGNYIGAGIDATALALGAVPVLGDIARKGFKSLFAQDVKNATELLKDTKLIDKWKKDNPNPKPQKRNPDVQKAANELLDGKITGKQYRSVVKENMPIKKIEEVPEVPTFTEIVGSLTSDKSKKGIIGLNKEVKDGTRVASRLDIPAYEKHDTWVVSVHNSKNKKGIEALDGDIIGYGKTAVLKNVEFKSLPASAAKISAKRQDKGTIARIFGDYINAEPEQVASSAKKFLKDPEWTQVGYNPFRQGFFYNKDTGIPVKSAEEVLQVGPLVLAKNVKKFTISEAKKVGPKGGLKIRTSGKTQVVYNEGGTVMKKQMEMFDDGGLKDEGGMIDEVSGNDVPSGSTREEVRDDIPAQLSEGEFVFPADVVRYIGLEKLMTIRQEAKQGLKQMEAMGQMGNSDEATMRDDMPFDINDLDMEDEVEYNRGGVVEAANGTYVAPTVPTGIQPLGTNPMGNPVGVTQQVADGVSGSTQGTPYTPNVGNMYAPTAQAYAPVSYNEFLGPSASGAPTTESVRYFNEATGQTRMIPHLVNADGSRGDTLYPVPEGFVMQEEAPKEEAKKTAKVQSTQVQQQDDGGESEPMDTSTKDPTGISYNKSTLQSGELKSLFDKVGVFSGLSILNPSLNIARSVMGKGNVAAASNAALGGIIDGFRGGDVNYFGTNQRNTGLQSGTYNDNRSLNSLTGVEQKTLGSVGNAVFSSVIEPMLYDVKDGKNVARSDLDIRKEAVLAAERLNIRTTIPGTNIAARTETIMREVARKEAEKLLKQKEEQEQRAQVARAKERAELAAYEQSIKDKAITAAEDRRITQIQQESQDSDGGYDTGGGYSVSDSDFSGFYNQGGLAGKKKKKLKVKRMKRGGLASR